MSRTYVALGLVGLGWAALAGCAGTTGGSESPDDASKGRSTALEHEPCDLGDSGAKPLDADLDGRPEILSVMKGGRELCRAVDLNRDGVVDRFVYFDEQGRERRMETGFDTDSQPDEVAYFEGGVVVRKERQTNHDGKIDTWDYYEAGRLAREERDSNADGFVDQWWLFDAAASPDCPVVVVDADGDGKPDESTRMSMCDDKAPAPAGDAATAPDAGAPDAAGGSADEPPAGATEDSANATEEGDE